MTTPFLNERAAEIIAAYGGNPARWPDAERAMTLLVVAADPRLASSLTEARFLDEDLASWARRPVLVGDPVMAADAAMRTQRGFGRWIGGGVAAMAAAALLLVMPASHVPVPVVPVTTVTDSQAFAALFTPTPDEENSI